MAKAGPGRKPRGRVGKRGGGARNKRRIQINGLDLLHTQTVLSTSTQERGPAAPGCIDQPLTKISLPTGVPVHEEIPPTQAIIAHNGKKIPYGLHVMNLKML